MPRQYRLDKTIRIDLENLDSEWVPLNKVRVSFERKRILGILKELEGAIHKVQLENVRWSNGIELHEAAGSRGIVSLNNEGVYRGTLEDIPISSHEMDLGIFLNPGSIKDYKGDDGEGQVTFTLAIQQTPEAEPQACEYTAELFFKKQRAVPDFTIKPATPNSHKFEPGVNREIGVLEIRNKAEYSYAYAVEGEIELSLENSGPLRCANFGRAGSWRDEMSGAFITLLGPDSENGSAVPNARVVRFENLPSNATIKLPVYVDFDLLRPPVSTQTYSLRAQAKFFQKDLDYPFLEAKQHTFEVYPDPQKSALDFYVGQGALANYRQFTNPVGLQEMVLDQRITWVPGKESRRKCFSFILSNRANSGHGGVYIADLSIRARIGQESTSDIDPIPPKDLDDCFFINAKGKNLSTFRAYRNQPEWIWLENRPDSKQEFSIELRHDSIKSIPDYVSTIQVAVSFKYFESNGQAIPEMEELEGLKDEFQEAIYLIEFEVGRHPGKYWLAIDFGTSAIVAAFAKDVSVDQDSDKLLNLQAPHRQYCGQYYSVNNVDEHGSLFLSSTVVLRNEKVLEGTTRNNDLVYLAPIREDQYRYPHVPYLKSLIGTSSLPDFSERLQLITYKESEQSDTIFYHRDKKLKVDQILLNAYNRLLTDYILETVNANVEQRIEQRPDEPNKVILTVPNHFTPRHIFKLRELFAENFDKRFKAELHRFHQRVGRCGVPLRCRAG